MSEDDAFVVMDDSSLPPAEQEALAQLRSAASGPPHAAELAGWSDVLAAYRSAQAGHSRSLSGHRRSLRRWAAGLPPVAALSATLLLPSGAVAAAYTGHLPGPVQHWAHAALAPVGVPARHKASEPASRAPERATPEHASGAPEPIRARGAAAQRDEAHLVRLCSMLLASGQEQQAGILRHLRPLLPSGVVPLQHCRLVVARQRTAQPAGSRPVSPRPSPRPEATPGPSAKAVASSGPPRSSSPSPSP
jgi:hypothetical protein